MTRGNVEDIYGLSPMQQGMLFHSISTESGDVYYERMRCTLRGKLNVVAFQQAWLAAMQRHAVLRTAFSWKRTDLPVQIVLRQVALPWEEQDWRHMDAEAQAVALREFLDADQRRGFDLTKAPLMRLALLRTAEDTYDFVWSFHHILKDGWSTALVLKEVLAHHEALRFGRSITFGNPRPFRDYIAWLQRQDTARAERFWRRTLQGCTRPTPLPFAAAGLAGLPNQGCAACDLPLTAELTEALQALARRHQLTLNTLVQGAWGLLLHAHSGAEDIVFGTTVTGRPVDLPGVEQMVGLFINTLPVHMHVDLQQQLPDCLKALQNLNVELRQYEYTPLVQVQRWSAVQRNPDGGKGGMPLFESILIFENVPVDSALLARGGDLEVQDLDLVQQANYPLSFIASLIHEQLNLRITYDSGRYHAEIVWQMLEQLRDLLARFVEHPEATLDHILAAIPPQHLVVELAATFTADPLLEPLLFVFRQLALPTRVQVAAYGQVFQHLMDPRSALRTNRTGLNVVLCRLEDWVQVTDLGPDAFAQRLARNVEDVLGALELTCMATSVPWIICLCPPSERLQPQRRAAIERLEQDIVGRAGALPNVRVLSYADLLDRYPIDQIGDPYADEIGHIPYTQEC
jgi:surfactin family lipopeptide synthetase C